MEFSYIEYGQVVFCLVLLYIYFSYKRKFITLSTYIGLYKLMKVKNQNVENLNIVHSSIQKELKINLNNIITIILMIIIYLFLLNFTLLSANLIIPVIAFCLTLYLNKMYYLKYKTNIKDLYEK